MVFYRLLPIIILTPYGGAVIARKRGKRHLAAAGFVRVTQEKDHWYTAPYPIPCLRGRGILRLLRNRKSRETVSPEWDNNNEYGTTVCSVAYTVLTPSLPHTEPACYRLGRNVRAKRIRAKTATLASFNLN